jgi:heme/copper-type cytochrome/quinol oxidase subunit 2
MKACNEDNESKNHTLLLSTITSAILSLCVLLGVVIFAVMKVRNEKKHNEKWKDYDECGI